MVIRLERVVLPTVLSFLALTAWPPPAWRPKPEVPDLALPSAGLCRDSMIRPKVRSSHTWLLSADATRSPNLLLHQKTRVASSPEQGHGPISQRPLACVTCLPGGQATGQSVLTHVQLSMSALMGWKVRPRVKLNGHPRMRLNPSSPLVKTCLSLTHGDSSRVCGHLTRASSLVGSDVYKCTGPHLQRTEWSRAALSNNGMLMRGVCAARA